MNMTTQELIQNFLKLQHQYFFTKRMLVTAERFSQIALPGLVDRKDYDNKILREPLVEHIGHLPIIASYFYPHIEHSKEVNLGRALIMLSIHDIGETVTGEFFTYHKTDRHHNEEYEAAREIVHPTLQPYLEEYEKGETLDAKYAKSVDVLGPNIHEVDMPKVTFERFYKLGANIEHVIAQMRPFMEWDSILLKIFDLLMKQYTSIEFGLEPVFEVQPYDLV